MYPIKYGCFWSPPPLFKIWDRKMSDDYLTPRTALKSSSNDRCIYFRKLKVLFVDKCAYKIKSSKSHFN